MSNLWKNLCVTAMTGILLGSLVSCGGSSAPAETTTTPDAGTTSPEVSQPADTEEEGGETASFPAIEDYDVLRVGMDLQYPPFSYLTDEGNPAGLEPAISFAFGEYLGVDVEIVDSAFSMLIPALETDQVDILIADMAATPERAEKVDFSDPYRYTNTLALVNRGYAEENGITDDMSEEDFFALGANFIGKTGTKGIYYPETYGVMVTEVTEIGLGLVEVSSGLSDVLIASNEIYAYQAADPDNTMVYAGIRAQDASNFAVKQGNTELLEKANEFIALMYEEGGLYDILAEEFDPVIGEFLQNDSLGLDYIVTAVD